MATFFANPFYRLALSLALLLLSAPALLAGAGHSAVGMATGGALFVVSLFLPLWPKQ